MKIISVVNQKGGTGKTTSALNIGNALIKLNKSVLFIDMDAQSHLTQLLLNELPKKNIADILESQAANIDKYIYDLGNGSGVITANYDLANRKVNNIYSLNNLIKSIKTNFDYCIIDTAPKMDELLLNCLCASDYYITISSADILSYKASLYLEETITAVKTKNKKLAHLGVILTQYNPRTILEKSIMESYQNKQVEILGTTRRSIAVKEAQITGTNLFDYAPKSSAAADYLAIAKKILQII